jgi:hypothetical protein
MFEPLHAGKDLKFILYCFRLPFLLLLLEEFGSSEVNDWMSPLQTNQSAPPFHAWQLTFNAIAMNKKRRSRLTVQPLGLETACSVLAQIPWSEKILFTKLI